MTVERSVGRAVATMAVALVLVVADVTSASTAVFGTLHKISRDPYTNPSSQHATQVEPDTFAWGNTVVMAAQTGRFFDGGSSNIAVSRSPDGGVTWVRTYLPGITTFAGGPYDRASDPAVAYDLKHNIWLVSVLGISTTSVVGETVLTSRSLDGGTTWENPVVTASFDGLDKNWVTCDDTPGSRWYGNCYTEFDDFNDNNRVYMTTSTDGGLSWGVARKPLDTPSGIGGQPLVQPGGRVIVPLENRREQRMIAFTSDDGGTSWSSSHVVSQISAHVVAGGLRTSSLPSAEIDAGGKVYLAWQDCRYRAGCASNDIVLSTSSDGAAWSVPARIPIDFVTSTVDHFIPGLAVDRTSHGTSARLALTYYYYPKASCTASTCRLKVGYVSSADDGASWAPAVELAGPMSLSWIAATNQGAMVGDYISTSFVGTAVVPAFAVASPPSGGVFHEAIFTASGLGVAASRLGVAASRPSISSDVQSTVVPLESDARTGPVTRR